MTSVCPAWRANVTSSSATTRPPPPPSPRPLPNACRSPSAESIDARRQIVHVERLHEVARVSQVEHGDQRLHAHVGGRHDHGECGVGGADLLQQGDAVGVGETEIEHQHFGAELLALGPRLGAAPGEGDVVPRGEAPIIRPPQRRLVLDEQHLAPRRGGGGPHGGAIYAGDPRRPRRPLSGRAALQLEQVVQFGEHKEKAQLLVRPPQAHRQAAFRRLALNQHQRAQTRAVHLPRSRQVDHQPPGPLLELLQQLARGAAERRARIETQLFGGGQDSFAWARRHRHHVLHGQLQRSPRLELCDSGANPGTAKLTCGSPTGCQSRRECPHATPCRRPSGAAHIARRQDPPTFTRTGQPYSSGLMKANHMAKTIEKQELTEVSEAQIAVHWKEEEYYQPSEKFKAQANMRDPRVFDRFGLDRFPDCFKEYADMLTWFEPYRTVLDTSDAPFWKWFVGGKINASYNCVDRHLERYGTKAAFIFVPEQEAAPDVAITYRELYARVNEVAALLRGLGLKAGDRVTLHMPMVPELPITMLACARLGVIHSQVFGGFSGQACGSRIQDSGSRVLITMDAYSRSGALIDHKVNADIAVKTAHELGQDVDRVLVWQRYPGKASAKTPMVPGRDVFVNDLLRDYQGKRVDPVRLSSEAPLFLMYSSGTSGKPKGAQHGIAGYLAYVTATSKWILDIRPDDVYWCMADIGWITVHYYIVYGPLASAATGVLYEGVPTYPDAGRPG